MLLVQTISREVIMTPQRLYAELHRSLLNEAKLHFDLRPVMRDSVDGDIVHAYGNIRKNMNNARVAEAVRGSLHLKI